ncbi:MAG: MscL family protein, partial [Lachnospiraceae bacterium]|nr:MscL family protein [Lachnospiraceae bacterium]
MGGFMKEFKEFISKGNVMTMAVGIIIGGAFTAIINSLVADVIGPLIGIITGGI